MKTWGPQNEFFTCECESAEHTVQFQLYDWAKEFENDPEKMKEFLKSWGTEHSVELNIQLYVPDWPGFWKRIWTAVKYVFRKHKYGDFDHAMIQEHDVERLEALIRLYKDRIALYKKYMEG